jgi:putative membrane protein insertion efficiency factor
MRKLIVTILRLYKVMLSPLLPSACRYYPSCSEYTRQAVEKYGVGRGLWMGAKRLSRCHPFHAGGLDPVPDPNTQSLQKYV